VAWERSVEKDKWEEINTELKIGKRGRRPLRRRRATLDCSAIEEEEGEGGEQGE